MHASITLFLLIKAKTFINVFEPKTKFTIEILLALKDWPSYINLRLNTLIY